MFQNYIDEQIDRVNCSPHANLLGKKVVHKFELELSVITEGITGSSVSKYISQELEAENPFGASFPVFLTDEERNRAAESIRGKLERGEMSFPKLLTDTLARRLSIVTDAFLEMLDRMFGHRKAICDALTEGKLYTKIEDMQISAGDSHNGGRSVRVLYTDVGRLVYKPHDMRLDRHVYVIADSFFAEFVGIPKCIAFEEGFGVCEYIEKQRSEGEEAAQAFWYRVGGMTVLAKLLGSVDVHVENLTCRGDKPYIVDLETVLSPVAVNERSEGVFPELSACIESSVYLSGLLPGTVGGLELSVLVNTSEEGCAPVVNGKIVSASGYAVYLTRGYDAAYRRVIEHRGEIVQMIRDIPDKTPVRLLLRNTQVYMDLMRKLYHHTALSHETDAEKTTEVLSRILSSKISKNYECIVGPEAKEMKRGDVPYIYTLAGSRAIFMDGKMLQDDVYGKSAKEHALDNLCAMDEGDELFERRLIERALEQYPAKLRECEMKRIVIPQIGGSVLPEDTAVREAGALLETAFSLNIPSPDGRLFWGFLKDGEKSLAFCVPGLNYGNSGFAVFATACSFVCGDERIKLIADRIADEALLDIRRLLAFIHGKDYSFDYMLTLGEADGVGGIITSLELIRKYAPQRDYGDIDEYLDQLLERADFQRFGVSERLAGISGLLSALCRFERYREKKSTIQKLADRLLALKTLAYQGSTLWRTPVGKSRPLSGAGHGLTGIAEALFAAAAVLGNEKYATAGAEALDYECSVYEKYSKRYGTWADLRSFPPEGYMHGYCSGAPGIGIMMERIRRTGREDGTVARLARYARTSVDQLPLNDRDHLCCGNSAIVEYYLSVGDRTSAGRVLCAMYDRKRQEGSYRYMSYDLNNCLTPSLFYGLSGVGYEMLRYAFPDQILSLF